jgi:hypothetical protein
LEKQNGTLEVLLGTSLSERDFMAGHWSAMIRLFGVPLAAVILIEIVLAVVVLAADVADHLPTAYAPLQLLVAGAVMLPIDAVALTWTGLWQGIAATNGQQARNRTTSSVLAVPWLVCIALFTLSSILLSNPNPRWQYLLHLWFWTGLLNSGLCTRIARRKLLSEFRLSAQRRFESPKLEWWWWLNRRDVAPRVSQGSHLFRSRPL